MAVRGTDQSSVTRPSICWKSLSRVTSVAPNARAVAASQLPKPINRLMPVSAEKVAAAAAMSGADSVPAP